MNDKKISKSFNIVFAIIVTFLYLFDIVAVFLDITTNFILTIPVISLFIITIVYYYIIKIKKHDFQESIKYLFKVLKITLLVCIGIGVCYGLFLFLSVSYKTSTGKNNVEFFGPLLGIFANFFSAFMIIIVPLLLAINCFRIWLIIPLLNLLNKSKKAFYIIFGIIVIILGTIIFCLSKNITLESLKTNAKIEDVFKKEQYNDYLVQYKIYNDKLYYLNTAGYHENNVTNTLYETNLDGSNRRKISKDSKLNNMNMIEIIDNNLYFNNDNTYMINLENGEIKTVSEDYIILSFLNINNKMYAILRFDVVSDDPNIYYFDNYYVLGEYDIKTNTYIEINRTSNIKEDINIFIDKQTLDIYYLHLDNGLDCIKKNTEVLYYQDENQGFLKGIIALNNNYLYFYDSQYVYCLDLATQEFLYKDESFRNQYNLINEFIPFSNNTYSHVYNYDDNSIYNLNISNNRFEKIMSFKTSESVNDIIYNNDILYITMSGSNDLVIYNPATNSSKIINNVYKILKDNKSLYIVDNKDFSIKKITK